MDSTIFSTETPTSAALNVTLDIIIGSTTLPDQNTTDFSTWGNDDNTSTTSITPEGHSTVTIVFIAFVAFILMVSTVGGNLLVIIAYHTNRKLRSVNNLFLVSLAFSDLVIGIVSMNLYPVTIILKGWYLGEVACDIWLCIDYTLSMASVANLMLICLDRYFSVIWPFKYRPKRTRSIAKVAIILAWIISMLLWAPAIIIWPRVSGRTSDPKSCMIEFFVNPIITSVTAILAFYLPVLIMIILYWRIYGETKRCREYLDYLRSYRTSSQQSSSKSPFSRRKSRSQSIVDQKPPRRRLNSSPATAFYSSRIWRPDPLVETPNEGSDESVTAVEKRNGKTDEIQVRGGKNTVTEEPNINNNLKRESNDSPVRGSRLRRFTLQFVGSIRNSIKKSSSECSVRADPDIPSCTNSEIIKPVSSATASSHRRASSDSTTAHEMQSLLSERTNGFANSNLTANSHSKRFIVPAISTSDHSEDSNKVRKQTRRTVSDTDSIVTSKSLFVPSSHKKPLPRNGSTGGESSTESNRIPSSDRKAAKTLSAILLAFVVTWLPYNICVLYSSFCKVQSCENTIPQVVWDFAYYLCYINSTLNPFCYAACNKTFRNTFIRLLSCTKRGSQTKRIKCCWRFDKRRSNDTYTDQTATMQPSSSSSRSLPPSPFIRKRGETST